MPELLALSAVLLLSAAVLSLLAKWRRHRRRAARRRTHAKPISYAAVGIRPSMKACHTIRQFYDKRFLCNDAPLFPVAGCRVRPCPCRYIHFADRRAEERRVEFGIGETVHRSARTDRRRSERRRAVTV